MDVLRLPADGGQDRVMTQGLQGAVLPLLYRHISFPSARIYRACCGPENQRFHKNQPKMLIFNRNLAQGRYFQLVLKRLELWVVSEISHCVEGEKGNHVFARIKIKFLIFSIS